MAYSFNSSLTYTYYPFWKQFYLRTAMDVFSLSERIDLSNVTFSHLFSLNSTELTEISESYAAMNISKNVKNSQQYFLMLEMFAESTIIAYPLGYLVAMEYLDALFGKSAAALYKSAFVAEKIKYELEQDRETFEFAFGKEYYDVASAEVQEMLSEKPHEKTLLVSNLLKSITDDYTKVRQPYRLLTIPKTSVQDAFNLLSGNSDSLVFEYNSLRKQNERIMDNTLREYQVRQFLGKSKLEKLNSVINALYSDKINYLDSRIINLFSEKTNIWTYKSVLSGNNPAEILSNAEFNLRELSQALELSQKLISIKPRNYFTNALNLTSEIYANLSIIEQELNQMNFQIKQKEQDLLLKISEKRKNIYLKFNSIKSPDVILSDWFVKQIKISDNLLSDSIFLKTGERFQKYAEIFEIYSNIEIVLSDGDNLPILREKALLALKSLNRTIYLAELDGLEINYEKSQMQAMFSFLQTSTLEDIYIISTIPSNCRSLEDGIYLKASMFFDYLNQLRLEYLPVIDFLHIYMPEMVQKEYQSIHDFELFVVNGIYSPQLTIGNYKTISSFYNLLEYKIDEFIFKAINTSVYNSLHYEYFLSESHFDQIENFSILITAENKLPFSTPRKIILPIPENYCGGQIELNGINSNEKINIYRECSGRISEKISENVTVIASNSEIVYIQKEITFKVNLPHVKIRFFENANSIAQLDGKYITFDGIVNDLVIGVHKLTLTYYFESPVYITINYINASNSINAEIKCQNNLHLQLNNFEFNLLLENFSQISTIPKECSRVYENNFYCKLSLQPLQSRKLNFYYSPLLPEKATSVNIPALLNTTIVYSQQQPINSSKGNASLTANYSSIFTPSKNISNSTSSQNLKEITQIQKTLEGRITDILSLPFETNLSRNITSNLSQYIENAKNALNQGNIQEFENWANKAIQEARLVDEIITDSEENLNLQLSNLFIRFDTIKSKLNQIFEKYQLAFSINGTLKAPSLSPYLTRLSSCSIIIEEVKANLRVNSFSKVKSAVSCVEKLENDYLILNESIYQEMKSAEIFLNMAKQATEKSEKDKYIQILLKAQDYFDNGEYLMSKMFATDLIKNATENLPITFTSFDDKSIEVSENKRDGTIIFIVFAILFILLFSLSFMKKEKKEQPWVIKRVRHSS